MKHYCFALDLKDDPQLIAEYEEYHRHVWPEVLEGLRQAGVNEMEIHRVGNRLFMLITADDEFSMAEKLQLDASNEKVQEWEALMSKYQQSLPWALPGEKWMLMEKVFHL